MPRYEVECDVGTITTTVTAENESLAMDAAVEQWMTDSPAIFLAGTFCVDETTDDSE